MRKGSRWIWVVVALLAAPAVPAVAGGGEKAAPSGQQQAAKAAEERMVDLGELRAEFFERLGELLAGDWLDARGTIVPEGEEEGGLATLTSADCARGTIVPGCG